MKGVRRFKDSYVGMDLWQKIADWSKINRTKEQIRNRHSRLRQQKVDPTGALLPKQTVFHHYVGPSKEFATPNKEQPMFTQASQQPQQSSSNFLSTANASISSFTSNNQTSFVPQVNAPVLHQQQQTQLFAALLQQAHNSHFDLDKAVGNHHFDDVDDIIDEPSAKRQKTVHHGGLDMGSNVAFNIGSFSNAAGLQSPSNNVVTPYNPVDSPLVYVQQEKDTDEKEKKIKALEAKLAEFESNVNNLRISLAEEQQKNLFFNGNVCCYYS
jgi:hypothetical protein